MRQVKIFSSWNSADVEKFANEWLVANGGFPIVDISFINNNGSYAVMIVYKKVD